MICLSAILLAMLNTIRKIAEACLSKLLFAGHVSSYQSSVLMDLDILTVSLSSSLSSQVTYVLVLKSLHAKYDSRDRFITKNPRTELTQFGMHSILKQSKKRVPKIITYMHNAEYLFWCNLNYMSSQV